MAEQHARTLRLRQLQGLKRRNNRLFRQFKEDKNEYLSQLHLDVARLAKLLYDFERTLVVPGDLPEVNPEVPR